MAVAQETGSLSALELARTRERFVLRGVTWHDYEELLADLGDRPVRVTYDRGGLEFMTLSRIHEIYKRLLARLIEALLEFHGIPYAFGGSMTFRREDLDRGLEADECYWIAHEPQVRGKLELDLKVDPAPDVALEIDISSSSLERVPIYAALKVAQLWRFDGDLQVGLLTGKGEYQWGDTSPTFPGLSVKELLPFIEQGTAEGPLVMLNSFKVWLEQRKGTTT